MPEQNRKRKKLTPADRHDLEVRISFIEGLVRRDPNYVDALQLLGDHYTQRGRISFIEGVVRRDPNYVDALQLLGDHYTQRGRYAEGLKVDERLAQLEPRDPSVFYNLACSYT